MVSGVPNSATVVREPLIHFHTSESPVSGVLSLSWTDALPGTNGRRQPTCGVEPQMNSVWQVDEQPSPLVVLPSSHSSPQLAWTTPSPQIIELPVQVPPTQASSSVHVIPSSQLVSSG